MWARFNCNLCKLNQKEKSFWLHELLSGNKGESQRWSASSVNGVSEAIGSNTFLNINSDRRALSRTCKSVGSKAKIFTPWIKTANLFNDESHWATCICALDVDDSSLMHALFMLNYVSFPYRLRSFIRLLENFFAKRKTKWNVKIRESIDMARENPR